MHIGLTQTIHDIVTHDKTAIAVGSGDVEVYATPAMIMLMERAAKEAVIDYLADNETTVGAQVNVSHDRPSPLGDGISATAVLTNVEGRKLTFAVKARDTLGLIGSGTHVRYVVSRTRFIEKLFERKN